MPYVMRDHQGRIFSVHQDSSVPGSELVPPDNPELIAFLYAGEAAAKAELAALDLSFIRVIEDVIDILVQRNLILFTELPPVVQEKLNKRRLVRNSNTTLDFSDDIVKF